MKKTSPHRITQKTKSGFTIMEFSLAIGFVGFLLVTITVIANNVITLYRKGLTLKAVNSVGRSLSDEFITSINAASSIEVKNLCKNMSSAAAVSTCTADNAQKFVYQERLGNRKLDNGTTHQVQLGGVFCTGKYSYVWNTHYAKEGGMLSIKYLAKNDSTPTFPSGDKESNWLFRFEDTERVACAKNINYNNYQYDTGFTGEGNYVIDVTKRFGKDSVANPIDAPVGGFLRSSDLTLQLYELTIFPVSQDIISNRAFFSGTFILGTNHGNINIKLSGDYCTDATGGGVMNLNDPGSEFNYCAINRFNFAARTAGK